MDKLKQYIVKGVQSIFAINISPLLFMVLFSGLLLLDLIERAFVNTVSYFDMLIIVIYGIIVLIGQYIFLRIVKHITKQQAIYFACIALLFVANIYSFYLTYSADFESLLRWQVLSILSFLLVIIYMILRYSEKWVFTISISLLFCAVMLNILIGQNLIGSFRYHTDDTLPENYIAQDFTIKPNIYLLSYDGMVPQNIAKKMLQLDDNQSPAYINSIDALGADVIPNTFVHFNATLGSFASMFALDINWYKQQLQRKDFSDMQRALIMGGKWTPVHDIFKRNGYNLNLIYGSKYFYTYSNSKEVNYFYPPWDSFACDKIKIFDMWGYCYLRKKAIFLGIKLRAGDLSYRSDFNDIVFEEIKKSDKPQFILSYRSVPGHVNDSYNFLDKKVLGAYREKYLEKSIIAADFIENRVKKIRDNDKNAIIIIFGDHGIKATDFVRSKNIDDDYYDETSFIQDKAIMMAVLDPHGCQIAEPVVTTLPDMMHNLITCLTGGKPVLKNRYDGEVDFIDYLYDPVSSQ